MSSCRHSSRIRRSASAGTPRRCLRKPSRNRLVDKLPAEILKDGSTPYLIPSPATRLLTRPAASSIAMRPCYLGSKAASVSERLALPQLPGALVATDAAHRLADF